jgi:hypothetical protein
MTPTFTLQLSNGKLDFARLVRLTNVDGIFDGRPMVWFDDYDQRMGQERKGVAIIGQDGKQVLYCSGSVNGSFSKTYLYARKGYLFKLRYQAADAVNAGHKLEIYVSVHAGVEDEKAILSEVQPPWNRRG